MSAFQQAFSKWFEASSEEDRRKAPEIVKGLEMSKHGGSSKRTSYTNPASSGARGRGRPPVGPATEDGPARPVRQGVPVLAKPRPADLAAQDEALLYWASEIRHPTLPRLEAIAFVPAEERRIIPKLRQPVPPSSSVAPAASLSGITKKSTVPRVQVGLDFGTSSTKVLFRRVDIVEPPLPVAFDHELAGYPSFALPSIAVFDRTGQLVLGDVAARLLGDDWARGMSGFKMLAAGRHDSRYRDEVLERRFQRYVRECLKDDAACTPELLCSVFLAFVMRRTRRWLEHHFMRSDVEVRFNTCVPVDQRQNSKVFEAFCRIAAVAQLLERTGADADSATDWLRQARENWLTAPYDEHAADTTLYVIPEAVAATAGYVYSDKKVSGLHALVDIGAGTADVSILQISSSLKGGVTTDLLGAKSIPMGAAVLEEQVSAALRRNGSTPSRASLYEILAGRRVDVTELENIILDTLCQMRNGTAQAWSAAYKKIPGQSKWTGSAVKVFLSGGGALIPESLRVFSVSWQPGWGPYPTCVVPDPDIGVKNSELPFARLCVAHGLTIPRGELGKFVMPDDVPAGERVEPFRIDYSQDGDQLIPRPGWTGR